MDDKSIAPPLWLTIRVWYSFMIADKSCTTPLWLMIRVLSLLYDRWSEFNLAFFDRWLEFNLAFLTDDRRFTSPFW